MLTSLPFPGGCAVASLYELCLRRVIRSRGKQHRQQLPATVLLDMAAMMKCAAARCTNYCLPSRAPVARLRELPLSFISNEVLRNQAELPVFPVMVRFCSGTCGTEP